MPSRNLDPISLLWRDDTSAPRAPGRPPLRSIDDLVRAAVGYADEQGVEALSVRALARALQIPVTSVFSRIPDRSTLLLLMVDWVLLTMSHQPYTDPDMRKRLRTLADDNYAVALAHPWLSALRMGTPPIGPGHLRKYERELAALLPLELSDIDTDACLTLLVGFSQSSATERTRWSPTSPEEWDKTAASLSAHVNADAFPLAVRIGAAAGAEFESAYQPSHAWEFGLTRLLEGILSHGTHQNVSLPSE